MFRLSNGNANRILERPSALSRRVKALQPRPGYASIRCHFPSNHMVQSSRPQLRLQVSVNCLEV